MDLAVVTKILTLFAALLSAFELLPERIQGNVDARLKWYLSTRRLLKIAGTYLFVVLAVSAFLHWAGYVVATVFVVFFVILFIIVKNMGTPAVLDDSPGVGLLLSWGGILVFLAAIYLFAFVSWLFPFEKMVWVLYPYEYVAGAARGTWLSWLIPTFSSDAFLATFDSVTKSILNNWFAVDDLSDSGFRFLYWPWIYMRSAEFLGFIALLIVLLAWTTGTVFVMLLILSALMYPFFQMSRYVREKAGLKKTPCTDHGYHCRHSGRIDGHFRID